MWSTAQVERLRRLVQPQDFSHIMHLKNQYIMRFNGEFTVKPPAHRAPFLQGLTLSEVSFHFR